jgi:hypothetical protein
LEVSFRRQEALVRIRHVCRLTYIQLSLPTGADGVFFTKRI